VVFSVGIFVVITHFIYVAITVEAATTIIVTASFVP